LDPLLDRHIRHCDNAVFPGGRQRLTIGEDCVGWVTPRVADALAEYDAVTVQSDALRIDPAMASDLPAIAQGLADRGFFRFRREEFDVRATFDGPVLARIDRGGLSLLGIQALGVHLNGLVRREAGLHLWVGRRAHDRALDPGKLDHLVAGGVPAGMTIGETLIKEAAEEAGMDETLASRAIATGIVTYQHAHGDDLRRDVLHCFDLELPESFVPRPVDGEVEAFELWPIDRVIQAVRMTDDFKFNVNLVLIDLFRRLGLI
jgi:8-oxo-dGTP pyrophosphatase MutT (NUDIX family)